MKRNTTLTAIIMALCLAGGSLIMAATRPQEGRKSGDQAKLAGQAKITMEQAREAALRRAPGTVESSELEREQGKLVYSFDIRNAHGTITEVQVSAINGKIVRVEHENKQQEAAEKKREQREKAPGGGTKQ